MQNKRIIGWTLFLVGVPLILYFVFWKETGTPLSEKVVVPKDTTKEITEVVEESQKIDSFILSKIPGGDKAFFKREHYTDHSHDEGTTSDLLREETMKFVYSAFMLQDIDQLTVAFSSDSIRSLQSETDTVMDLPKVLANFLSRVNRDNQLEKLEYQFEIDEYDKETNKGLLTLIYSDGIQTPVEIELQSVGDEEHLAFEVITPLSEFRTLLE